MGEIDTYLHEVYITAAASLSAAGAVSRTAATTPSTLSKYNATQGTLRYCVCLCIEHSARGSPLVLTFPPRSEGAQLLLLVGNRCRRRTNVLGLFHDGEPAFMNSFVFSVHALVFVHVLRAGEREAKNGGRGEGVNNGY